ncbi:GATA transcription factor 16-like [Impatiens glandulifera]|uniref:GATA transcription factor 16-like n=1 Tax=Impatiens glandulifera TaxID=253017 RepID=UPI001FB07C0E|nr:GATA transcription factor 16-like [Impatiens glandulifera]
MTVTGESPDIVSSDVESSSNVKICSDCYTSKTPFWRAGPAGPKSLCNACGIRSKKKKIDVLGLNKNSMIVKKKKAAPAMKNEGGEKECCDSCKSSSGKSKVIKLWPKMGEVEKAAVILMSLSWGSFDSFMNFN